ncbi:MAG: insulinase family protein [Candidatus Synoicihabitans palmerolidicus]|nr:insulinase family protein [Candidatus Synoicihabitans palmerolidicus]
MMTAVTAAQSNLHSWTATALTESNRAVSAFSDDIFYSADPRFALVTPAQIDALNPTMVRNWLRKMLPSSPLELELVGDFDLEDAIASAAIGTRPDVQSPPATDAPRLQRGRAFRWLPVSSQEPQASLLYAWPVDGVAAARQRRTLEILEWIFQTRIVEDIREGLGATYAPSVHSWESDSFPDQGYLQVNLSVAPRRAKVAQEHLVRIAQDLATKGITAEELKRARTPLIQAVDQHLQANPWIYHVVSQAQTNPQALVMPHTRLHDLQTITEADVEALAHDVLSPPPDFVAMVAAP